MLLYTQTLRVSMRQLLALFFHIYISLAAKHNNTSYTQLYPIHNSVYNNTLYYIKGAGSSSIFIELTESATNYILYSIEDICVCRTPFFFFF